MIAKPCKRGRGWEEGKRDKFDEDGEQRAGRIARSVVEACKEQGRDKRRFLFRLWANVRVLFRSPFVTDAKIQ